MIDIITYLFKCKEFAEQMGRSDLSRFEIKLNLGGDIKNSLNGNLAISKLFNGVYKVLGRYNIEINGEKLKFITVP